MKKVDQVLRLKSDKHNLLCVTIAYSFIAFTDSLNPLRKHLETILPPTST